jgi:outer membrane protein W
MARGVWFVGFAFVLGLSTLGLSTSAFAADVVKVQGRGALINLSGESASPGDTFFALNAAGKKKAIIQIIKLRKGDQAIGKITAGQAAAGMVLQRRAAGKTASSGKSRGSSGGSGYLSKKAYWGLLGGMSLNTMSVDLATTPVKTVALSGSSFSALGVFDYSLFDRVWFRGSAGYQGFTVAGDNSCSGSTCNVDIAYIGINFIGRYLFTDTSFRPWLGGGFSILFPATKASTALDSGSITNSSVIILTGGADWSLTKETYIPISVEYGMFPKSNSVEASWIAVRAGYVWPF